MPELTPKQLREIERANAILAEMQTNQTPQSNKNFAGSVQSQMDV